MWTKRSPGSLNNIKEVQATKECWDLEKLFSINYLISKGHSWKHTYKQHCTCWAGCTYAFRNVCICVKQQLFKKGPWIWKRKERYIGELEEKEWEREKDVTVITSENNRNNWNKNGYKKLGVVTHIIHPGTQETGAGGPLSLRRADYIENPMLVIL